MAITVCTLDCPDTCSIDVTVEAGRITKVDAAPGNPMTDGWICAKVKHHAQRVYSPERVLTPLVRVGPKGAGEFVPCSWDEALDRVEAAMRDAIATHGPASIVPYLYNSSGGVLGGPALAERLWRRLGASKVNDTICAATAGQAYTDIYGSMLPADPMDVVHSRFVLVWGANPTVSNVHFAPLVQQAVRDGATLAVVDPRRTAVAARARYHLALRPGTDVALALAMTRHLAVNDLIDRAFLAEHVDGVDAYLANAEHWTLDRAAGVCGVPATMIAEVAEAYVSTKPALLRMGWGLERNRNGGSACRSVLVLPLFCGHFGDVGSGVITSLSKAAPVDASLADPEIDRAMVAAADAARRQVNMNSLGALLCRELDETPVALLFVQGANPAAMNPAQTKVLRGLGRDDLFTVVHEQVLTDTARYADIVLPATTHFEVDDLKKSYGSYVLQRARPVIDRVGESRTNDEVTCALALRFDLPATVFDPDAARQIDAILTDRPLDEPHVLRAPGTTVGFRDTFPSFEDRRARLHHPDSELPLPRYRALESSYPLALLSPATHKTINSMFAEFDAADAVVHIHPDDAALRGIANDQRVRVWNDVASIVLPARLDRDLSAGCCVVPKGLWLRHVEGNLTANALAPDELSDLAGGACFNDARVQIGAIE